MSRHLEDLGGGHQLPVPPHLSQAGLKAGYSDGSQLVPSLSLWHTNGCRAETYDSTACVWLCTYMHADMLVCEQTCTYVWLCVHGLACVVIYVSMYL